MLLSDKDWRGLQEEGFLGRTSASIPACLCRLDVSYPERAHVRYATELLPDNIAIDTTDSVDVDLVDIVV